MDEETKQQVLVSVIVMALTVTIYQIVFNSGMIAGDFSWIKLVLAVIIGAAAGGATYGVMKAMNR